MAWVKLVLILSCIMLKITKNTLKPWGVNTARFLKYAWPFSTICLKELTEHYLNQAFIPVKSKCWMTEWSIWVKIVSFVLMECNDDLNLFQSFIILLLLAPSHISEIPKGKIQFFLQLNPVHVLLQHHHQFFEMICFAVKFWRHKQAK